MSQPHRACTIGIMAVAFAVALCCMLRATDDDDEVSREVFSANWAPDRVSAYAPANQAEDGVDFGALQLEQQTRSQLDAELNAYLGKSPLGALPPARAMRSQGAEESLAFLQKGKQEIQDPAADLGEDTQDADGTRHLLPFSSNIEGDKYSDLAFNKEHASSHGAPSGVPPTASPLAAARKDEAQDEAAAAEDAAKTRRIQSEIDDQAGSYKDSTGPKTAQAFARENNAKAKEEIHDDKVEEAKEFAASKEATVEDKVAKNKALGEYMNANMPKQSNQQLKAQQDAASGPKITHHARVPPPTQLAKPKAQKLQPVDRPVDADSSARVKRRAEQHPEPAAAAKPKPVQHPKSVQHSKSRSAHLQPRNDQHKPKPTQHKPKPAPAKAVHHPTPTEAAATAKAAKARVAKAAQVKAAITKAAHAKARAEQARAQQEKANEEKVAQEKQKSLQREKAKAEAAQAAAAARHDHTGSRYRHHKGGSQHDRDIAAALDRQVDQAHKTFTGLPKASAEAAPETQPSPTGPDTADTRKQLEAAQLHREQWQANLSKLRPPSGAMPNQGASPHGLVAQVTDLIAQKQALVRGGPTLAITDPASAHHNLEHHGVVPGATSRVEDNAGTDIAFERNVADDDAAVAASFDDNAKSIPTGASTSTVDQIGSPSPGIDDNKLSNAEWAQQQADAEADAEAARRSVMLLAIQSKKAREGKQFATTDPASENRALEHKKVLLPAKSREVGNPDTDPAFEPNVEADEDAEREAEAEARDAAEDKREREIDTPNRKQHSQTRTVDEVEDEMDNEEADPGIDAEDADMSNAERERNTSDEEADAKAIQAAQDRTKYLAWKHTLSESDSHHHSGKSAEQEREELQAAGLLRRQVAKDNKAAEDRILPIPPAPKPIDNGSADISQLTSKKMLATIHAAEHADQEDGRLSAETKALEYLQRAKAKDRAVDLDAESKAEKLVEKAMGVEPPHYDKDAEAHIASYTTLHARREAARVDLQVRAAEATKEAQLPGPPRDESDDDQAVLTQEPSQDEESVLIAKRAMIAYQAKRAESAGSAALRQDLRWALHHNQKKHTPMQVQLGAMSTSALKVKIRELRKTTAAKKAKYEKAMAAEAAAASAN